MSQKLTATLRLQLIDGVSGEAKDIEAALKGVNKSLRGFGKGGTSEVDKLSARMQHLQKVSKSYSDFHAAQTRQYRAGGIYGKAKQEVEQLARAMAQSTNPTQAMRRELFSARNAVMLASAAFREETAAAKGAKSALEGLVGVGGGRLARSQKQIRDEIRKTTDELKRADQEARKNGRGGSVPSVPGGRPGNVVAMVAGGAATTYGVNGATIAFDNSVNMDQATRYQRLVGEVSEKDQTPLTKQSYDIGGATGFSNIDVVKAQTKIMAGGVHDVGSVLAMTEAVRDYALAMNITMEESAETVRAVLQQTGKDLTTAENVKKNSRDMVNFMVDLSKRSGMQDDDIRQYYKYGGASGKGVGFSDSTMGSVATQLRKAGIRGEEGGVFLRAAASKMVAPTSMGLDALNAMGLEYSDYVSMPDVLSSGNIQRKFKRDFGKKLSPDQQSALDDALQNGTYTDEKTGDEMPISADQGIFTERVSEILGRSFKKGKNGKLSAVDQKAVAKSVEEY